MKDALELMSSARAWASMSDALLRVRVMQVIQEREAQALCDLVSAFVGATSRRGYPSEHTLRSYRVGVLRFLEWAWGEGGCDLIRPGRRDGERYVFVLRGLGCAPATVASRVAAARRLFAALQWAGVGSGDPFAQVVLGRELTPSVVRRPPYQAEIDDVLALMPDMPVHPNFRLRVLLLLCLHAGLRIAEALEVSPADVEGAFLRVHGKGGKQRLVPLSEVLRLDLAALAAAPGGSYFDWSYSQVNYRFSKLFTQAGHGGQWRGFHAFRKACATRLYEASRDFARVGVFMGHSRLETSRDYVVVPEDDLAGVLRSWTDSGWAKR